MFCLREAREEEAQSISELALASKAYWGYSPAFIGKCRESLTIDADYIRKNQVFVLDETGTLLGFYAFDRDDTASLDFLFIHPEYIGQGLGEMIWHHAMHKARELGIRRFTIDSDPYAKGFYEKMGAKHIGNVPSSVVENRLLPLMEVIVSAEQKTS
ncbi:N-acetyltransferase [Pullulanibacillus camelliae]|uniref:N-acetyltransferase n=1 Tax=Pullulanibacillus camelliae TaxID=1707096 RepID=A0A8J2YLT1_9BACL|nr:GNAT family N-acetyltransferase [Pullulanibacillus camelliae]GGE50769.1 N-acetyltransferase [Pullulanibacillus camelliae]